MVNHRILSLQSIRETLKQIKQYQQCCLLVELEQSCHKYVIHEKNPRFPQLS